PTTLSTLSLHDALPIFDRLPEASRSAGGAARGLSRAGAEPPAPVWPRRRRVRAKAEGNRRSERPRAESARPRGPRRATRDQWTRSEEHTSELQSRGHLV